MHPHRAVPVQGAGRAVPGGSSPSVFRALVLCSACLVCGGVALSPHLPSWLRVSRPRGLGPCGRGSLVPWGLWGGEGGRAAWGRSAGPLRVSPWGCGSAQRALRLGGGARRVGSRATRPAGWWRIRPFASPAQATRRASTASHWPWRVRTPYCSGSCPCAAACALPNGGVEGRPVALPPDQQGRRLVG